MKKSKNVICNLSTYTNKNSATSWTIGKNISALEIAKH